MHRSGIFVLIGLNLLMVAAPTHADDYTIDPAHAAINFKVSHLGLSWVHGRFNSYAGTFSLDPDPAKCSFAMTMKTESIDTNNTKRDEHLRGPDFFNVKHFPTLSFKSTKVTQIKEGFQVTGDLTLHGVTKTITLPIAGGRKAEFPKGIMRVGFSSEFTIKRTDFGMDKFTEAIGDVIHISLSFEGTKK